MISDVAVFYPSSFHYALVAVWDAVEGFNCPLCAVVVVVLCASLPPFIQLLLLLLAELTLAVFGRLLIETSPSGPVWSITASRGSFRAAQTRRDGRVCLAELDGD